MKRIYSNQSPKVLSLFFLIALLLSHATTNLANANEFNFDIPQQSLDSALSSFAETADMEVFYSAELTRGINSNNVSGNYDHNKALEKLLNGTGLGFKIKNDNTVTLLKYVGKTSLNLERVEEDEIVPSFSSKPKANKKKKHVLVAENKSNSTSSSLKTLSLKEIQVIDKAEIYETPNESVTNKTGIPVFKTPSSIQVIPRQVIKDQRINNLKDGLEYVSGVRSFSNDMEGYVFLIRGFKSFNIYRNGLLSSVANATTYDTGSIERIEVLKGPSSLLYGRAEPGGLFNLVPKKPAESSYYNLEQEFGSYNHYRTVVDASMPLTPDNKVLFRFSGAYQDSGSFRDFHEQRRALAHPSLVWRPSEKTQMLFDLEYFDHQVQNDVGIPVINDRPAGVPISRSYQEPDDPIDQSNRTTIGFELKHEINKDWSILQRFHYIDSFLEKIDVNQVGFQADGRTLNRQVSGQQLDTGGIYATNFNLNGNVEIFGKKHNLLMGFDYYYELLNYFATGSHAGVADETIPALAIDVFNPVYAGFSSSQIRTIFEGQSKGYFPNRAINTGVYFQDQITLTDTLQIMGGFRYDWAKFGFGFSENSAEEAKDSIEAASTEDEELSPRVGILYNPVPWMSLWGSWSNSFGTNNGISASLTAHDPEDGEQWEIGMKGKFFNNRLNANLALFHLTKSNVLTNDLSTAAQNDTAAIGEARSQGVELDIIGQITSEWSITANYAYTDTEVTKDNGGLQGNRLENAALNSGGLFLRYDVLNYEPLNGLRLGFGGVAVSERKGDAANSFKLPGYTRLDAFAGYSRNVGKSRVTAQLNLRNLTDKEYFEGNDTFFNLDPNLAN